MQKEGFVLYSKKLELKMEKVSFFGAEYTITCIQTPRSYKGKQR